MSVHFEESNVEVFMGGKFTFKDDTPKTVGQLKEVFTSWIKELDGWGDDSQQLMECQLWKDELLVTLQEGIAQ